VKKLIHPKARDLLVQTWQSKANLSLFLVLLVITVFVLPTITVKREHLKLFADTVFTLSLGSGVAMGWGRPRLSRTAALVVIPTVVLRWAVWFAPNPTLQVADQSLSLISTIVIAYVILAQVFSDGPINVMRVQGAVAAYLLLGVAYAFAFQLDASFNPAAIVSTEGQMTSFIDWLYFSFCTLSTLGYGDIIPVSHLGRSLAIAEAISGQLYLAILIARLVAMQVEGASRHDSA
jgi:hypothetical protein